MTSQNSNLIVPHDAIGSLMSLPEPESATHLAIETTGQSGSLALLKGADVIKTVLLAGETRTAAALTPAIGDLLSQANLAVSDLDFVTVAEGPGSFTGLRIGVTTAKTLCYAQSILMVAVDSLAAIAETVFHDHAAANRVLVGLNAYRSQVFAAEITREHLLPPTKVPAGEDLQVQILEPAQWTSRLKAAMDQDAYLAGDEKMFAKAKALTEEILATRFLHRTSVDAVGVGLLGIQHAKRSEFRDPMGLTPKYLKLSAAEEKLL